MSKEKKNKKVFTIGTKISFIVLILITMLIYYDIYWVRKIDFEEIYTCSNNQLLIFLNNITFYSSIIALIVLIVFVIISIKKPDDYFKKIFIKGCIFGLAIPIVLYIVVYDIKKYSRCEIIPLDAWMTIESKENKIIRV